MMTHEGSWYVLCVCACGAQVLALFPWDQPGVIPAYPILPACGICTVTGGVPVLAPEED